MTFDPSADTLTTPKEKYKGGSNREETGAKLGCSEVICDFCVKEQKAGRKRVYPIGHCWADCWDNPKNKGKKRGDGRGKAMTATENWSAFDIAFHTENSD